MKSTKKTAASAAPKVQSIEQIRARKGARRMSEIPREVLLALNAGLVPTVNLVEFLAVDMAALIAAALHETAAGPLAKPILIAAEAARTEGVMTRVKRIGQALGVAVRADPKRGARLLAALAAHRSDMVRQFASFVNFERTDLPIAEVFEFLRPFAADPHFGVRETAWLAGRDPLIADLDRGLKLLVGWSKDKDPNVRRFASEISRPRGVWCAQIDALKKDPEKGKAILEPLKSDASKYVQDSVGNWLNDASKSAPDWVRALCRRWEKDCPTPETARITKRALRTLAK